MKRREIEELFYGNPNHQRRFTQDFPILPDVWIEYGDNPGQPVELLLTPHNEFDAPTLARAVRARLRQDSRIKPTKERRILYNESVVLAKLTFDELLRGVLPLTAWWRGVVMPAKLQWTREALLKRVRPLRDPRPKLDIGIDPGLLTKLIRIVACIEMDESDATEAAKDKRKPILTEKDCDLFARAFEGLPPPGDDAGVLWGVSLNRRARTSVWRSRLTVKADAAARLFQTATTGIRWAVLDTGVDATHPAFSRRDDSRRPTGKRGKTFSPANSRIVRTYDFMRIKQLLDPDVETELDRSAAGLMRKEELSELRQDLRRRLLRGRAIDWDLLEPFLRVPHEPASSYKKPRMDSHGTHVAGILAGEWPEAATDTPVKQPLVGMCPDLEIYDLRVLPDDPDESSDEFTIIAALQFVRHINSHKDLMVIHGVNLSLSVPHDVANYACGRTPVCEECERVVATGVVVVTAAGNRGFNKATDPAGGGAVHGGTAGDYRYISITDPGNADAVITVGSTHRQMPHNYGVSYFSSRGPTGDGRTKPDLVAPGERIDSAALNGYFETMDGTSQAAPHVSGAAALLMSRHRELIGQPGRVKEILCRTATDLGREPRFQGAGMVDVLRALQSV
jgi:serine protease AprX